MMRAECDVVVCKVLAEWIDGLYIPEHPVDVVPAVAQVGYVGAGLCHQSGRVCEQVAHLHYGLHAVIIPVKVLHDVLYGIVPGQQPLVH